MLCNVAHKAAVNENEVNICLNYQEGDTAVTDESFSIMCSYNVELLSGSQQNAKGPAKVLFFIFFKVLLYPINGVPL